MKKLILSVGLALLSQKACANKIEVNFPDYNLSHSSPVSLYSSAVSEERSLAFSLSQAPSLKQDSLQEIKPQFGLRELCWVVGVELVNVTGNFHFKPDNTTFVMLCAAVLRPQVEGVLSRLLKTTALQCLMSCYDFCFLPQENYRTLVEDDLKSQVEYGKR